MPGESTPINLTNHFLIAMPALEDAMFGKSVVYVCEHTSKGALGLVINKPAEMKMDTLFSKIDLSLKRSDLSTSPVFQGGPVQTDRGFVLHEPIVVDKEHPHETLYASTMSIDGGLEMTTSKDVLEALAGGNGPGKVIVALGYAAWGEGQLESELVENSWLTVNADRAIIFDTPVEQRYEKALSLLGLQSWMISNQVGHA